MRILSFAALTAIGLIAATPLMAQTPQTKTPETKMAPAKPADTKMAPAKSSDSKATEHKAAKTTGAATSEPLDLNTATAAQLEALPEIGKTRAEAIIKARPFKAKDELVDKKILSKGSYDKIKDKIIAKQS